MPAIGRRIAVGVLAGAAWAVWAAAGDDDPAPGVGDWPAPAATSAPASAPALATASAPASAPAGAKLVEDKLLLTWDPRGKQGGDESMRLSPEGDRLLYLREETVQTGAAPAAGARPAGAAGARLGGQQRCYRFVLRTLADGTEAALPIPAYTVDDIPRVMLWMKLFGAGGGTIVLGAGVDADGDGLHDHRKEKMQTVLYDIASGKATAAGPVAPSVYPTFDRSGKGVIIATFEKESGACSLYTTPVEEIKLAEHKFAGIPLAVCPAADAVAMVVLPDRATKRKARLVLYDPAGHKELADLPIHERNTYLDDYPSRWTAGGGHLYYVDVRFDAQEGGFSRQRFVTRIWDRSAAREAGVLEDVTPIGSGPGETTMVLARHGSRSGGIILHDAATGVSRPVGDAGMKAVWAEAGRLVYVKTAAKGLSEARAAGIAPPPATQPAPPPDPTDPTAE